MNYLLIILCFSSLKIFSAELNCGRTAIVDQKTVLIDAGSRCLGEGLRFYLEKDPEALKHFNLYQEGQKINWFRAGLSMGGTGLLIGGLLLDNGSNSGVLQRDSLIYSGALFVLISYVLTKTHNYNNERHLQKSIEEYNKRSLPKIKFGPIYQKRQSGYDVGVQFNIATY